MRAPTLLAPVAFAFLSSACASLPSGGSPHTLADVAPPAPHRIGLLLGRRVLEDAAYEGVEAQPTLGVEYVHEPSEGWLGWEAGFLASKQDDEINGSDVEASTQEVFAGARATFVSGAWRPYVGLGLSVIRTEIDAAGATDDGGSVAGYARAGISRELDRHWRIGLELRTLLGSHIEYETRDTDGDYGQIGLVVSRGF